MDLAFQTNNININPTTTNNTEHEHHEEEISDPLQQWLLFDPPPIHHQEQQDLNLSSSTSSFQSINYQSIRLNPINTFMPSHDGTGHFFTPPDSLSPTATEYNYHPITAQSLRSLSEFDSQNDDLLSIPSSLSISHSGSSRSSNFRTRITHSESMSPEDSDLLLTPMAISAGLSHHNTSIGTQRRSSRSSHQSIDCRARRSTTGGSQSQRTRSHSSHRSRIRPIITSRRPSSRNPPPVVLIPSHPKKINLPSANRQAALDFLTSVASKILDLDSDTMNMLSTPHENQTSKSQANNTSRSHTTKNRSPPRFSIGDDAQRSLTSQEKDMISSPMDLSGFMPPSPTSIWRMTEERAEEEEDEEEQESVGQDDNVRGSSRCLRRRQYGSSATLKTQPSRNYDPRHSSPSTIASTIQDHRQLRGRTNTGFQDPDLDLQPHSLLTSSDTEPPSCSSMATILLKRVLDEWTNW
ncbi:uncharacterized protein VP01_2226g3 [Puccinia sorghi]|uniref:Uncharacterized protein n=1 Tax=Puccinia sorghi TaxID=27349 RepID=A0A0L6V8W5_9BASI|nr:uncharacterized protein VP01_2226g3 [Puccinia sorghi]